MDPQPDWDDVRTLAALAETGGLRPAARRLGLHPSTVARRLDRLQTQLGLTLVDRRAGGATLTEAGLRLARAAEAMAAQLSDAARDLAGQERQVRGRLSVTMAEPLAVHAIVPALPHLFRQHPELQLDLQVTADLLDVSRGQADIAIRMDNHPPPALVGKRLFAYGVTAYASPAYLTRHPPDRPGSGARWLGWDLADGPHPDWIADTPFPDRPAWGSFGDLAVQQAAARAGLGLALLPCFLADRDTALVRATADPPRPARDIWILTHKELRAVPRVRAFLDFAEDVLRRHRAALTGLSDAQAEKGFHAA